MTNFITSLPRILVVVQFIVLLTVTPYIQAQDITELADNKPQFLNEVGVAGTLREIGTYGNRDAYAFTALPNGKTLVYGVYPVNVEGQEYEIIEDHRRKSAGQSNTFDLHLWLPQHHSWKELDAPPECKYHRFLHTMTPLKNGNILIAGGLCDSPQLLNKQTPYPPHTKLSLLNTNTFKWEAAPTLSVARIFHTANLLNDGSVLLVGGENDPALRKPDSFVINSVEAFQNGQIELLPPLHTARAKHTATLLNNGTLMVIGGIGHDSKPLNTVEIWDPVERQWRDAPQLVTARTMHSATLLGDGRLMISGGLNADGMPLNSVEIWNPSSNTWSAGKPLIYPLQAHASSLLANGDVLVMGGLTLKDMAAERAMLWSKASEEWRPAGLFDIPMYNKHYNRITLVPLADGSARAFTNYNILQWQPAKASTNSYPPYGERDEYASTLLNDGRILFTGGLMVSLGSSHGAESPPMDAAEIYDPVSNRFTATGRMNQSRFSHSAIPLNNGDVVVAGGWVRTDEIKFHRAANFPEVWNAKTGIWSMIPTIHFEAYDSVHLSQLQDGRVLFFASNETEEATSPKLAEYRAWLWDPQTGLVESKQVPMNPHSGAAIAILPDGRVMRVGGKMRYLIPEKTCPKLQPKRKQYKTDIVNTCQTEAAHWEGATPDPSAEIWDSHSGNVVNIAPPPEGNVLDSKSLVLKNGNVVFVEHRPIHPYRNPLPARIILWGAKNQAWQKLPALPDYLTWPMVERDDGSLVTETHYLPLDAQAWVEGPRLPLPSPRLAQNQAPIVQLPSGQLLALSTVPPYVALLDKDSTQWQVQSARDVAPTWLAPPAAVVLADGSVMVIASVDSHQKPLTAHIWHPKENSWINAGKLTHTIGDHTQALSLPSKNVMHIAIDQRNNLLCNLWQASANTWKDCSDSTVLGQIVPDPGLGLLADGRVVLVASPSRVFVFDEEAQQWSSMKAEWYSDNLTYGAPIRANKPLLQIFDAAQNTWLNISGVAGKYWQNTHTHREYQVDFSDQPSELVAAVDLPPAMLWDDKTQQWAYLFEFGKMGRNPKILPDGCAFSWRNFTLFNPKTGTIRKLIDPGVGIKYYQGSMDVLADGTVVFAGIANNHSEPGAGFFHRKLTCAGFENTADDEAMMPAVAYEEPLAATKTAVSAKPTNAETVNQWRAQLKFFFNTYRWNLLAVFGPFSVYLLAKRVVLPALSRVSEKTGVSKTIKTVKKSRLNSSQNKAVKSAGWIIRVVIYGLLAIYAASTIKSYFHIHKVIEEHKCAENPDACIDKETGLMRGEPSLAEANPDDDSTPRIPCKYVGIWSSRRGSDMYRIALKDDGTYSMMRPGVSDNSPPLYIGYWTVQGNNMVWRHKIGNTGEADINPIQHQSDSQFTLTEGNGSHTVYELIEAVRSSGCTQ